MGTETELKLAVRPEDIPRVGQTQVVAAHAIEPGRSAQLKNVYYDTPQREVIAANVALRLREQEGRWIQAVKSGGPGVAGLHTREEFETLVSDGALDLEALAAICPHPFLRDPELCGRIGPRFRTDFERTQWELRLDDQTRIELACDRGQIEADGRCAPISEIELELKSGDPARLFEVARSLAEVVTLLPEDRSKSERGYALAAGDVVRPVFAEPILLDAAATVGDAFAHVLASGLLQLQRNLPALLDAGDPEAVHQARVGQRRIRAALLTFRKQVPASAVARFWRDLKWFCAPLGPARDMDVLLERLAVGPANARDAAALAELQVQLEARRTEAYAALAERLADRRSGVILLDCARWVATRAWRDELPPEALASLDAEMREIAPRMLSAAAHRVTRRGRRFGRRSDKELHALRLAVKQLRYTNEFFASLFPGRKAERYCRRTRRFQNRLGEFQDGAVGASLIKDLKVSKPVRRAARRVFEAHTLSPARCRKRAHRAWDAFRDCRPFW